MLDVYLSGDVERISPEAPVPIVRIKERKYALGGACNVAQNVAAIGAVSVLISAVARDRAGDQLREMLLAIGESGTSLIETGRCTTQKTRIISHSQQLLRVDEEEDSDLEEADVARVLLAVRQAIASVDAVVLEDYNKGVLVPAVIETAIASARDRGIPIIVDPKYRNFFHYRGATVFKPNRRELEKALGAAFDVDHPETLPGTLARLGVEHLLLTLGERGMMLVSASGDVMTLPTVAREVYDVVGAGDTVTAYLAVLLAAGASAPEAAYIANIAAGIEVAKLGAATVSVGEIDEHLDALGL